MINTNCAYDCVCLGTCVRVYVRACEQLMLTRKFQNAVGLGEICVVAAEFY